MSKYALAGVVGGVVTAVLLVGIIMLPRLWADSVAKQVARTTGAAAQPTVREIAEDAARKAARETAQQMLPGVSTGGETARPAPSPAPVAVPLQVERDAFAITLPPGSSVDPQRDGSGSERLVETNLPGHCTICIAVCDSKEQARGAYDKLLAGLRSYVDMAQEASPEALDAIRTAQATAMTGTSMGVRVHAEVGECDGWDKALVLMLEYPDEDRDHDLPLMVNTVKSLHLKQ